MDVDDVDSDDERKVVKNELYEIQKMMNEAGVIDKGLMSDMTQKENETEGENEKKGTSHERGTPGGDILWAAEKGKLEKISELLTLDSTLVCIQDRDGYTPLHRACYSNNVEIVKFLLEHNADVHACTADGWAPLHSACKWNNYKCASLLLDFGADINLQTNGGQTPLHLASSHPEARETLMLLLLHPQIQINICNNNGELASEIAHRHCKYYKLFDLHEESFNVI